MSPHDKENWINRGFSMPALTDAIPIDPNYNGLKAMEEFLPAFGKFMYEYAAAESDLNDKIQWYAASKTGGPMKVGIIKALMAGTRFNLAKDMALRVMRAAGASPHSVEETARILKHFEKISRFRDRLAHHPAGPSYVMDRPLAVGNQSSAKEPSRLEFHLFHQRVLLDGADDLLRISFMLQFSMSDDYVKAIDDASNKSLEWAEAMRGYFDPWRFQLPESEFPFKDWPQ
jgi:hypothetical protein